LDTTSTNNDKDSGRFFIGEPCFTTPPVEVGNKIDSLIKAFNGLRCLDSVNNVVFVEFLVDSIGNTSRIKIAKSLCPRLNKTALIIVGIAKFKPARCGEQKTQMRMTYKLNFSQSF
jgi:TonB family protein